MKKDTLDTFAIVSLTAFSILLGLNQVLVKLVNEAMNPVFQAGLRSACALPLIYLYCLWRRKKICFSDGSLWPGVICAFLFSGEFILLFLAVDYTSVVRVSIFFYTMPFWMALAAHFVLPNEKLTFIKIFGLAFAFVGVVVAFFDKDIRASDLAIVGDIMCIFAAMFWAAIGLMMRTTKLSRSTPEMQLLYQLLLSAPIILFASMFFGEPWRQPEIWHFAIFAFQVIVLVVFGFTFWFFLLTKYPASSIASFAFLAPIFGVLFGWLILNENISTNILLALLMVCIGLLMVNRKNKNS